MIDIDGREMSEGEEFILRGGVVVPAFVDYLFKAAVRDSE